MMAAARKVVAEVAKAHERAQVARQSDASALTIKNDTVKALDPAQAKSGVGKLTELFTTVAAAAKETRQALANAEQGAADVNAIKAKLENKKKAQCRGAGDQEEEGDGRGSAKVEEQKALIRTELQSLESAQSNCMPLIVQHRYQDAADELAHQASIYKTDEGKKALKMRVEKMQQDAKPEDVCNRAIERRSLSVGLQRPAHPFGY